MDLKAALQREEFSELTDAEALTHGNETGFEIARDDARWSYPGVAQLYGAIAAEAIGAAMQQAGLTIGVMTYAGEGLQLSDSQTQDFLTGTAATQEAQQMLVGEGRTLADVCNLLKEKGITHGTRWQLLGVEQPTLEAIGAERALIANELSIQSLSTHLQAVIAAWRSGEITNLADALTAIAAYQGV